MTSADFVPSSRNRKTAKSEDRGEDKKSSWRSDEIQGEENVPRKPLLTEREAARIAGYVESRGGCTVIDDVGPS
ncbi:hypothetical protein HN011_002268 [Eciton burchellii]|nr:hypothetical protein HN011_002268 [Eciton burchellii]